MFQDGFKIYIFSHYPFFSLFCYVATGAMFNNDVNVTDTKVTSPRLGALVTPQGSVNFITAIMVIDLKLEIDQYVHTQMKEIYDHTEHLLQFFKVGQL